MHSRTLRDAWDAFEASNQKDLSLCQSALFRFAIPGLGGRRPSGARLTSKEIAVTLKTLASISISPDIEEHLREAQKETFALLNTPKKRQRQLRYYLNQFIDWGIKNEFFASAKLPEEKPRYIFYPEKVNRIKITERSENKKFTFSFNVDDYVTESLSNEQIQQHLNRINQEFISFRKYQTTIQRNREASVDKTERHLKLILGSLYREKGISLAEISLSKIVPFIQLKFPLKNFESEENPWLSQLIAQAKAQEALNDEGKCLIKLMVDFFDTRKNLPSIATKQLYIESLITYSKYVYHDETEAKKALNFEDIPLINRLKIFYKEVNKSNNRKKGKKNNSKFSNKYPPWTDILDVFEKLRFEADLETTTPGIYVKKRPLSARAKSLQNFVLLGFFVLIPPSRQRVIRELELGRTLKYGIYSDRGFIPLEKMANPSEAKYYIDLQPKDYKTGDSYGAWRGEFPNTEFPDGSKFYDYLNRWLFRGTQDKNGHWHGMREVIAAPGEKTVFVRAIVGTSFSQQLMHQTIIHIFNRWTGIPIAPHDLRHLYRTYINKSATGATVEERESAALWMRHSKETAEQEYSHLDCEQELHEGAQLTERLNQYFLNGRK